MSTSGHKSWLSTLTYWIPGMRSKKSTMSVAKYAFQNRYCDKDVLRTTLEASPFNFKPKEIVIKGDSASGLTVEVPRKLSKEEKDLIDEAFDNAAHPEYAEYQG